MKTATCLSVLFSALVGRALALDATLGLSANNLDKNGISFGFLPAWGEAKSPNTATSLNAMLPKPMSIVGAYAQLSHTDPNITQIDPFIEDLLAQPGDHPVFNLALMPVEGLANVTQAVADGIAARMAQLNSQGITVWLRYAHEANGNWYAWGQQPAAFIESWEMVAAAVHAAAPDTYMLWSPNEMFAYDNSTDNVYGGYTPYWPAPDSVDIVGLSFYHYGGQQRLNDMPTPGDALSVMSRFHNLFAAPYSKPFILSEAGAAYTRDMHTGVVGPGNATEGEIKWNWLWQLTGPETSEALPWYKALCWFEVIKDENAADNTAVKEEDFRLLTGNETVAIGAVNFLVQPNEVTDHQSTVVAAGSSTSNTTAATDDITNAANQMHAQTAAWLLAVLSAAYLFS